MMSGLLLGIFLSVCTCWFDNMVYLPWLFSTGFGIWSCQCSLLNSTPISLHMLKCGREHALSFLFMYRSFANTGQGNMICSVSSSYCWYSLHLLSVLFVIFLFHDSWYVMSDLVYLIITIIIIIRYVYLLSQAFLPGTSLEPAVIPTAQASSFTLQYFPYYVWCSKYSCLL